MRRAAVRRERRESMVDSGAENYMGKIYLVVKVSWY